MCHHSTCTHTHTASRSGCTQSCWSQAALSSANPWIGGLWVCLSGWQTGPSDWASCSPQVGRLVGWSVVADAQWFANQHAHTTTQLKAARHVWTVCLMSDRGLQSSGLLQCAQPAQHVQQFSDGGSAASATSCTTTLPATAYPFQHPNAFRCAVVLCHMLCRAVPCFAVLCRAVCFAEVQRRAAPVILSGADCVIASQTGSGEMPPVAFGVCLFVDFDAALLLHL